MIVGRTRGQRDAGPFLQLDAEPHGDDRIVLGQAEGATGRIIFGADGANGAYGGFAAIKGGAGGGTVIFNEALGAGGGAVYWFNPNLTGNLAWSRMARHDDP